MVNRLKALLSEGRRALGVSVMIPSPQVVEMVGALGFDWVLIDCEHGAISLESVELMAMAAERSGISAVGRPPSADPGAISALLDRGLDGIQVPHVGTAGEAAAVVAAAQFPPAGRRSLAVGTRAGGYGLWPRASGHQAAQAPDVVIAVQVEDQAAVEQAPAIARVPGVDVVFVGPSDLSASLGHPGDTAHPEVLAALDRVCRQVRGAGKHSGTAGGLAALHHAEGVGATYFYTHLPTLLQLGTQALDPGAARAPAAPWH